MNVKSPKFWIGAVLTFAILFFMNYLGNEQPDKLERALITAFAGVVGLGIGLWWMNRNKDQDPPQNFD